MGVVPDVISFSAAASACEKAGEWQMALQILDEMPAARTPSFGKASSS